MPDAATKADCKRQWYLANRERLAAQSKARYIAKRTDPGWVASENARKRAYRIGHREDILPRARAHAAERYADDPEKFRGRARAWRETKPEKHRESVSRSERKTGNRRKRLYGVSPAEYAAMLEDQGGVCAVCSRPNMFVRRGVVPALSVDHNHTTGQVRGLLCQKCNGALGLVDDNPELAFRLAGYLQTFADEASDA